MHKWLQKNCTQFLTLFYGTVLDARSHCVICFVRSVSPRNHFLSCFAYVPEVRRNFDNTFQSNLTAETASDDGTCSNLAGSGQVPLAEIVLCAGFFVVFLIEELVLTFAKEEGTKE